MNTIEVPVPAGWDGFLVGIDATRQLIWRRCWHLDNIEVQAVIAFGKQGIAAVLPMPYKFLGEEMG